MVRRESFINKIRSLKYAYKDTQKRTYLYRKTGGTHYISVPMADLLEDEYVASTLRQAGETPESIRAFIAEHSVVT
jgi:hypothetical protein